MNSNTRYLHPAQTAFAEKILSKMPERLNVCFFVNSGTEANELALRLARAAMENVPLAVIAEELSHAVIAVGHEIKAHSLNLWWETLRLDLVEQALDEGFQVNVWTVNDPALAPALFDWGVSCIITDRPQEFEGL